MKTRFIHGWEDIIDALRSAGWALLLAGSGMGLWADSTESDNMHAWAKGVIMAGAGLWSVWALLKPTQALPPSQRQQM